MRGKKSHKGRNRTFTAPEEIDRQLGLAKSQENDESVLASSSSRQPESNEEDSSGADDAGDEAEDGTVRVKGVSHLIEVHNPNLTGSGEVPSRKETEAAARAVMDPLKLKSEAELASDLARLALVRKEREQAALKREQEKAAREAAREAAAQRAQARLQAARQKGAGKPGTKRNTAKQSKPAETTAKAQASASSDADSGANKPAASV